MVVATGLRGAVRGSCHVFRREGVRDLITVQRDFQLQAAYDYVTAEGARDLINVQRDGSQAKPYQVRQIRQTILRNDL